MFWLVVIVSTPNALANCRYRSVNMAINWGGVAGIIFFYLLIIVIGLWASRKTKGANSTEQVMVANRQFGWLFTLLTLTGKHPCTHAMPLGANGTGPRICFPGVSRISDEPPKIILCAENAVILIWGPFFPLSADNQHPLCTPLDPEDPFLRVSWRTTSPVGSADLFCLLVSTPSQEIIPRCLEHGVPHTQHTEGPKTRTTTLCDLSFQSKHLN